MEPLHDEKNQPLGGQIIQLYRDIYGLRMESISIEQNPFDSACKTDTLPKMDLGYNVPGALTQINKTLNTSTENKFRVADMPTAIHLLQYLGIRRQTSFHRYGIATNSSECIGTRLHKNNKGLMFYEVWHSVEPLESHENNEPFSVMGLGFTIIPPKTWKDAGNPNYNGAPRINLKDIKAGKVPKPGTPYIGYSNITIDNPVVYQGYVKEKEFMLDDFLLLKAGSPENLDIMRKSIYGKSKNNWFEALLWGMVDELRYVKDICSSKESAEIKGKIGRLYKNRRMPGTGNLRFFSNHGELCKNIKEMHHLTINASRKIVIGPNYKTFFSPSEDTKILVIPRVEIVDLEARLHDNFRGFYST